MPFRRDQDDDQAARLRTMAVEDAVNLARRAASATQAAGAGEPDENRKSALILAHRRLSEALRALQELA